MSELNHGDMKYVRRFPFFEITYYAYKGKLINPSLLNFPKFSRNNISVSATFGLHKYTLVLYFRRKVQALIYNKYRRAWLTYVQKLHIPAYGKADYYREIVKYEKA